LARLTIDVDAKNRDEATVKMLIRYFNIKYLFPNSKIRVDLTRKGYHIIVYDLPIPQDEILKWREAFGDDSIRIMLDENREPVGSNIMWSEKKGFVVKKDIKVI
jgi:hypothetical protein